MLAYERKESLRAQKIVMSQESIYYCYSFFGHTASQILFKKHMTYLQHLSNKAV